MNYERVVIAGLTRNLLKSITNYKLKNKMKKLSVLFAGILISASCSRFILKIKEEKLHS